TPRACLAPAALTDRTRSRFSASAHTLFLRERPAWTLAIMRILFRLVVFPCTPTSAALSFADANELEHRRPAHRATSQPT
ncbi:hypothetical protein, partial [uncultured Ilumatobacter sp.]|uniref:hypothetical protein n=1 Tax=uncultured Ilumatobacter sp. TaxID=879968 RepID=UPI00374F01C7